MVRKAKANYRRIVVRLPDLDHSRTAVKLVQAVRGSLDGWRYDVVSVGYPGPVVHGKPLHNPVNVGAWMARV